MTPMLSARPWRAQCRPRRAGRPVARRRSAGRRPARRAAPARPRWPERRTAARSAAKASTLALTSFTRPARSRASCSRAGLTMRQGPHQGACRSTMAGSLAASATSAKEVSSASAIHGSGRCHLPQRGVPAAAAGTRFAWPQCPPRISPPAAASFSTPRPAGLDSGRPAALPPGGRAYRGTCAVAGTAAARPRTPVIAPWLADQPPHRLRPRQPAARASTRLWYHFASVAGHGRWKC